MKLENLKLTNWILAIVLIIGLTGCATMQTSQVSTVPTSDVASDSVVINSESLRVTKLDLPGMYCQSCVLSVEEQLRRLNGVVDVNMDFEVKKGYVIYDKTLISAEEFVKNAFIQSYNGQIIGDQVYTPEYLPLDYS